MLSLWFFIHKWKLYIIGKKGDVFYSDEDTIYIDDSFSDYDLIELQHINNYSRIIRNLYYIDVEKKENLISLSKSWWTLMQNK
jgi:hypothetical protein